MWQTIFGAVGLLIAAGLAVWYKVKTDNTDTALAKNAADQANAAKDVADAQIKAKDDSDRQELQNEADKINAMQDADIRRRAALDALRQLRGLQ